VQPQAANRKRKQNGMVRRAWAWFFMMPEERAAT